MIHLAQVLHLYTRSLIVFFFKKVANHCALFKNTTHRIPIPLCWSDYQRNFAHLKMHFPSRSTCAKHLPSIWLIMAPQFKAFTLDHLPPILSDGRLLWSSHFGREQLSKKGKKKSQRKVGWVAARSDSRRKNFTEWWWCQCSAEK